MKSTHLEKERQLTEAGIEVPCYPKVPRSLKQNGSAVDEANFLAAFDSWEFEINRLHKQWLDLTRRAATP